MRPSRISIKRRLLGRSAFTLVELLVVIGVIGALAAGVGLLLRGNNPGTALRSAQSTLASALSSARGQAALNQANAMLIVQADPAVENFLRSVRVVVSTSSGWKEVGGEIILPEGVFVVPHNATTTTLSDSSANRLSTFFTTSAPVTGLSMTTNFLQSREISPLGAMGSGVGGRILVAPGRQTGANAFTIDNTSAVRGLIVSNYGVATLVNESETLDQ